MGHERSTPDLLVELVVAFQLHNTGVLPQVITPESGSKLQSALQVPGKQAARGKGLNNPCQGDNGTPAQPLQDTRGCKGASSHTHPKTNDRNSSSLHRARDLHEPHHADFLYLLLCSPWADRQISLGTDRSWLPGDCLSQSLVPSGWRLWVRIRALWQTQCCPMLFAGAGCLLPDKNLSARLPPWGGPNSSSSSISWG